MGRGFPGVVGPDRVGGVLKELWSLWEEASTCIQIPTQLCCGLFNEGYFFVSLFSLENKEKQMTDEDHLVIH
jgi:hypothetical protein